MLYYFCFVIRMKDIKVEENFIKVNRNKSNNLKNVYSFIIMNITIF